MLTGLVVAFAVATGSAPLPQIVKPGPVIANPEWTQLPSEDDVTRAHPVVEMGRSGDAQMTCVISPEGKLFACRLGETTSRAFANAALSLAPLYRVKTVAADGRSLVGLQVQLLVFWPESPSTAGLPPLPPRAGATPPPSLSPAPPPGPPTQVAAGSVTDATQGLVWTHKPSTLEFDLAHPSETSDGGYAIMECVVTGEGTLSACRAVSETYHVPGRGFGGALLQLAAKYQLDLSSPGHPVPGQKVRVSAVWNAQVAGALSNLVDATTGSLAGTDVAAPSNAKRAERFVVAAQWLNQPSSDDLRWAYPYSTAKGSGGYASMTCVVRDDGTLSDCRVVGETPPGRGFGSAALQLVPKYRMKPEDSDGTSVAGATVVVPIDWPFERERQ
ncbi:MAG TPA: energy transducer TonB [Caulobacteraceae bacterium]|jgi:TonB family protein|nr:energy transducer TonB [Caulobacteraceae bacterium]